MKRWILRTVILLVLAVGLTASGLMPESPMGPTRPGFAVYVFQVGEYRHGPDGLLQGFDVAVKGVDGEVFLTTNAQRFPNHYERPPVTVTFNATMAGGGHGLYRKPWQKVWVVLVVIVSGEERRCSFTLKAFQGLPNPYKGEGVLYACSDECWPNGCG